MVDPFESPKRKLERAKRHFTELEDEIVTFLNSEPHETFIDRHSNDGKELAQKVRLTRKLPPSIAELVGDVAGGLRAVLDQCGFAVAVAGGIRKPKNSYFPFAGSATEFEKSMKGRSADVPEEIRAIFRRLKPYRGGNNLLWALNAIAVGDKHKIITPVGMAVGVFAITTHKGTIKPVNRPKWDSAKQELVLATFTVEDARNYFNLQYKISFEIAFDEIEFVSGKPVDAVLVAQIDIVENIIRVIEAESKRIGLIP